MTTKFGQKRIITHLALAAIFLAGTATSALIWPQDDLIEQITLGSGYVALLMLAVVLLIGPINLIRKRSNPVNINLRRDVAIWAGIGGTVHVVFGFQVYPGYQLIEYFVTKTSGGWNFQWNLFTFSNYTGLLADFIMIGLLLISNQISLRTLKGKRWKFWQRFTYAMFVLVIAHTIGYQIYGLRQSGFVYAVVALTGLVVIGQIWGAVVTVNRRNQRRLALPPSPLSETVITERTLARRRFVVVTGTALLGGMSIGYVDSLLVGSSGKPATATASGSASSPHPVLATLATLPVNSARAFTTPDTNEKAFLMRLADGSFKAWNGVCTHQPFNLMFDHTHGMLVCNLHNVPFDAVTGAPTHDPARVPLKSYGVKVDDSGNVIYQSA